MCCYVNLFFEFFWGCTVFLLEAAQEMGKVFKAAAIANLGDVQFILKQKVCGIF